MNHVVAPPPANALVWVGTRPPALADIAAYEARRLEAAVRSLLETLVVAPDQHHAFICATVAPNGEVEVAMHRPGAVPGGCWVVGAYAPGMEAAGYAADAWVVGVLKQIRRIPKWRAHHPARPAA